ncbi:MAG: FkbM family methyltransferase [Sphaerospermopsis sp.]|nr:FkbM family methyltransferase [Sphaerospermopsis sp.]
MTHSTEYYKILLGIRPAQLGSFIKNVLQIKRQNIVTSIGYTFFADPVSVFGYTLLSEGIYESSMTRLLHTLLRPNDSFLDVGGNEGYFSVIAASLVQNGCVYCLEPQSRLQTIITENIKINKSQNVKLYHLALSEQPQEIDLFLRPSTNTGASSFFRHWKIGSIKETVKAITLDQFIEQNNISKIRLMKVDCEGAEYLVIGGGKQTLSKQLIQFIAMEYHPNICGMDKCNQIHQSLLGYGYTLTKANGQCIYSFPGDELLLDRLGNVTSNCNWNI